MLNLKEFQENQEKKDQKVINQEEDLKDKEVKKELPKLLENKIEKSLMIEEEFTDQDIMMNFQFMLEI